LAYVVAHERQSVPYAVLSGVLLGLATLTKYVGVLGIPVLLGSATPALESLHNAQRGRYQTLCLPERVGGGREPAIEILDVRRQPLTEGLSAPLLGGYAPIWPATSRCCCSSIGAAFPRYCSATNAAG
jgi:primosomal protein N' (replication factor Y)